MLSSHGVRFEHHDIAEDQQAAAFLRDRDIKAVPVVTVGDVVIVGLDERRLFEVLGLDVAAPADGTEWLATRYETVFDALATAVRKIGQARIDAAFPERRMSVRAHALHIVSFAEGGWLTHRCGRFGIDEMLATTARCDAITTVEAICDYANQVRDQITTYLRTADAASLTQIVSSHYGGEVPVLEVMRIMLRHSAHHLRQLDWFIGTEFGVDMHDHVRAAVAGITVPEGLFTV